MTNNELLGRLCEYACDVLTYEEYHSIPLKDWHNFVREHFIPIPKSDLVIGQEYKGICRNASKATWDGEKFWYHRYKFGSTYDESINHFEDDDGFDVFVPIKEKWF